MAANTETIKQKIHELASQLPDSAAWDDVIEEARIRQAVEQGLAEADQSEFTSPDEVKAAFSKWGVKLAE